MADKAEKSMNKVVFGCLVASVAMLGTGASAAAAGCDTYPPAPIVVTVDDPTPLPEHMVEVTMTGCDLGTDVRFGLLASEATSPCVAAGSANAVTSGPLQGVHTASAVLQAPVAPGTYTGSVEFPAGTQCANFVVSVTASVDPDDGGDPTPNGTLPRTGSGGLAPLVTLAAGLLLIGLALVGGGRLRRASVPQAMTSPVGAWPPPVN